MRYRFLPALLLLAVRAACGAQKIIPPAPPVSGPGSAEGDVCSSVKEIVRLKGTGMEYYLYEPADPVPVKAPLLVYLHGWGGISPSSNLAWIHHLVKRGNIVIRPRYQSWLFQWPTAYLPNTIASIKDATAFLCDASRSSCQYDPERFAVIGHSMGGALAMSLAATARTNGLPPLKAVMCMLPGTGFFESVVADLSKIPSATLLLCISAESDSLVGDRWAGRFIDEATTVPWSNKNHIEIRSDRHGRPSLVAGHLSPLAQKEQSAGPLARYGYWKWFDGLTDAAFYSKNREYALGDTREQKYMGLWSDGVPVREPVVRMRNREKGKK